MRRTDLTTFLTCDDCCDVQFPFEYSLYVLPLRNREVGAARNTFI